MKFSFSLSKLSVFFILVIPFLIIHSVSSLNLTNEYINHKCLFNQGKYRSGSKYEENLNRAFNVMRDNTYAETGFTDTDIGTSPDSVTIVSQCRGDTYGSKCHTCLDVAVAGVN